MCYDSPVKEFCELQVMGICALQRRYQAWVSNLEYKTDRYLLGRGLVDDSLSLSNETRCRDGVSASTAPSDWLYAICGACGTDVRGKRDSRVEGRSSPSELPWFVRGAMAERAGEGRRREGRAESLSELVS
jgi:hypothetical protein